MRFYTVERLSDHRSRTPEGYLLCESVPLARTGWMEYHPEELELKPAPGTDVIKVHRSPEEVFAPQSLASYAGKPYVDEHPADDVTPTNWRELAAGIIFNPRRGEGKQGDLLLGDILITCPKMIEAILKEEKEEVSVGYDCDYDEIGPGEYEQKNILVNHVAGVEQGRCGPRCRIGDAIPKQTRRTAVSFMSKYLQRAFKAKDAAELDAIEAEAKKEKPEIVGESEGGEDPSEQHIHLHLGGGSTSTSPEKNMGGKDDEEPEAAEEGSMEERLARIESLLEALLDDGSEGGEDSKKLLDKLRKDRASRRDRKPRDEESEEEREKREKEAKEAKDRMHDDETIEGALEMEAPPGTGDRARKARDSAYLADAWQQHVAYAEIIVPGARMPTFDSAARPAITLQKLCGARETLLERAYDDAKTRAIIDEISGNRVLDFKRMTCDAKRTMIAATAAAVGRMNNAGEGFGSYVAQKGSGGGIGVRGAIKTPADLNKMARELYQKA